ncbi:MAG: RDD family protein [Pseudomonadota bacterium]
MDRSAVVEYTPLSFRFAASLLDEVVVALLATLLGFLLLDPKVFEEDPGGLALTWALVAWLPMLAAYNLTFWRFGTTAGLWLLSSRVVSVRTGEPATLGRLLARLVVSRISLQLLGLGFWLSVRDGQRRTWYDRVAGTVVIADGSMRELNEEEQEDVRVINGPAPWLGEADAADT